MFEPQPGENQPPLKPSEPEGPKGRITVEYRQPDLLFQIVQNFVEQTADFAPLRDEEVSLTEINDELITVESTGMQAWLKNPHFRSSGSFSFRSRINLKDRETQKPGSGYFSHEKIERLCNSLISKGIKAESYYDRGLSENMGAIFLEVDGFYIEVFLGFPDRQTEETAKYPWHNQINLLLVDRERAISGIEGYPKLTDQADFVRALNAYTKSYEQILEAIYEEEGLKQPNKSIILRPPILSDDTVSQIKSVTTETPRILSAEQVLSEQTTFDEIAGQDQAVIEAKRLVLAINHPEIYAKRGVKKPKGILFYGPPGTGKTMLAEAISNATNAVFLQVSAADIGTKWYGESEKLMQEIFDRANEAVNRGEKVIIFFDEIDSLAPSREEAHEATRRIVATLLQNLDGIKANPNVTIIAATNRPQDIDPALKRPGRLDKLIKLDLPDAKGRQAILKIHMNKAKKRATAPEELFSEQIDFEDLAQVTEDMSGADLTNLVNLTLEEKTMAELEGTPWTPISTKDLLDMAKKIQVIREEKRIIGFRVPKKTSQNEPQSSEKNSEEK